MHRFLTPITSLALVTAFAPAAAEGLSAAQMEAAQQVYLGTAECEMKQSVHLRAIDGRIDGTDCTVSWLPNDQRGREFNPGNATGVFEDPCTGAIWSMEANAIEGTTEPLRTPYIDYRPGADGALHAFIERVNP